MVKNNLKNCTVNIKHAIDYIDRQLDHPATASIIKQRFLGRTAEQISNGNFAQLLGLPWNNWQDYGVDPIMRGICDYLEEGAGNAPVDNGSDAVGEYFAFRWANYQGYFDLVSELLEGYCEGPTRNGTETPDCSYSDISDGWFVSWMWQ